MTQSDTTLEAWREEILGYLLGCPSSKESVHHLPKAMDLPAQALRWWIFEGQTYGCLFDENGKSIRLSQGWREVALEIKKLRQHFNPRLKIVDHPGEPIDWPRTYALGPAGGQQREYVVQSSAHGLSEAEWAALCGWVRWIGQEWALFKREGKGFQAFEEETRDLARAGVALDLSLSLMEQMRLHDKWLRTALRSRWPVLRHLVAESLRCFSPRGLEMDQLPLPRTPYRLFELLGMVRIMKALHPKPDALKWVEGGNTVALGGHTFKLQHNWERTSVIEGAYKENGLRVEVFNTFGLRVHNEADLLILQPSHPSGFDAVLVEFKSGNQDFSYALHQLRIYQRMAKRHILGRLAIWGIVETPKAGQTQFDQAKRTFIEKQIQQDTNDIWIFSSAEPNDIQQVLMALGMVPSVPQAVALQLGASVTAHLEGNA